jgi:TonB-dependent starch-binding outer membrane protein SusC
MIKFYALRRILVIILVLVGVTGLAQTTRVTGKVTSGDDGGPLPGVSILEKGTTNGTVTDSDGNFTLSATSADATLVFSFVGYASQEIPASSAQSLNVVLKSDVTSLNEVVIVGYGEVQRKDATGAVAAILSKDFNQGVISSPQDLLVGKLAGVTVTTNSGAPGSAATIRIRGGASLSASNDPLIVIDGFPVDNSGLAGVSNALATINPNDIESYTVLKDASATAIYGSRASNGVIIITTKKGKAGKPQFSYNANVSMSRPAKYMDVLSGEEYRALVTDLEARGISGLNDAALDELGTSNTDWQKEIFRNAISHDHNLSVAGAIKKLPYRVSYGYTDQDGILKTTEFKRHSLNISLTPSLLNDNLKLTINAKGSHVDNNFSEAGAVGNAITYDPTQAVKDDNATYGGYHSWLSHGVTNGTANPVAQIMQTDNKAGSDRLIGNIQADYKLPFMPELKVSINAGLDHSKSDGHNYAEKDAQFTAVTDGNGVTTLQGRRNTYGGNNQSQLLDIYGNYTKEIGGSKFDFTAGYGWQHFYRDGYTLNKNVDGTVINQDTEFKNENFLISFFGRLNYTLKGKYLLTATLREDGSSRFAEHWGLFPSVALGWRIKDEGFLADVEAVSDLKLRAGYGQTGQQDLTLNQYPYLPIYRASTATAQYQLGENFYTTLRPEAYDANIKWETTTTYNLGLDFGFANDMITGSFEVYQRETSDLLNYIQVTSGTNFSNFLNTNVGNLENKGIEFSLRATPITRQNFSWNIGFNVARNVNKITKLLLVDDPGYTGVSAGNISVDAFIQNQQVGYPVNSFFVFQQVYDDNGNPIEGLYVDRSGQGGSVIGNTQNKYRFHNPTPKVLMGLNSRFTYRQFDFSFSSRLSLGNYVYNHNLATRAFYNKVYDLGFFSNVPASIDDTKFVQQQLYSDYYVQDASYFKMDNLSLGYNFSHLLSDKMKGRFSVTVQNAFVVTKYDGIDPEVDGGEDKNRGIDNSIYPRPQVFLAGLNFTF